MSSTTRRGFARLAEIPEEQVTPLVRRRVVTGDKEMLVFWTAKAGAHGHDFA